MKPIIKCPWCGAENEAEALKCLACGYSLEEEISKTKINQYVAVVGQMPPWKPMVAGVMGLLLGPIAAAIVTFINLKRLDRHKKANWVLALSIAGGIILFYGLFFLPELQSESLGKFIGNFISPFLYPFIQKDDFEEWKAKHPEATANRGVRSIGWGFIGLLLNLVIVFGISMSIPYDYSDLYGKRLEFNRGQLFYTSSVTETESNRLGEYLLNKGFFSGQPVSAQINKVDTTYEFRFVIREGYETSNELISTSREFAHLLSQDVFNSAPVNIHLCNDNFETIKVIHWQDKSLVPQKKYGSKNKFQGQRDDSGTIKLDSLFDWGNF